MTASVPAPSKTSKRKPATKVAPRDQATRSREARAKLLEATVQVLLEKGYNGLTTKEVALRSGLSNGALMHHYTTKAELVVAATAEVYDECIARGQRTAHSPQALQDPVRHFMSDCQAVYFEWPFIAAIEVLMVARTDDTLMDSIRPVMEHYRQVTNTLWLQVFIDAGYTPQQAELVLNLTLNQVRGLAVHRLWAANPAREQALLAQWLEVAAAQFPLPKPRAVAARRAKSPRVA